MSIKLNREGVALNAEERNKRNENWDLLEGEIAGINTSVGESAQAGNAALTEVNKLKPIVNGQAAEVQTAKTNASNALTKATAAETKVDSVQSQFEQVVIEGDSSVEAASARVASDKTYTTLKARLDAENSKVTEQVNETAERGTFISKELVTQRNRKAMITIIDDDGRTDVLTKWLPLLDSKNFSLDIAVITGFVGIPNYMTWQQLENLKRDYDIDLINHSHTHPYHATLTEEQLHEQFDTSSKILRKRGHTDNVFVYPYGSENELVRKVGREYFRGAFYTDKGVNYPPLETFRIQRVSLMSDGVPMKDLSFYKAYIDEAVANNGWIVFMTHSQFSGFDTEKVGQIIDYANSVNIEWTHAKEGLNAFGNIVDIGDYTPSVFSANQKYTVIDCDGKWHSNIEQTTKIYKESEVNFNTPLTFFTANKKTIAHIYDGSTATGFPKGAGGILETFRGASGDFSFQTYKIYNANEIHLRSWDRTNAVWGAFKEIGKQSVIIGLTDAVNSTTPIANYTAGVITVNLILDSNASGMPNSVGGTLETYRISSNGVFGYQLYKPHNSNALFIRSWDNANNVWLTWNPLSSRLSTRSSFTISTTVAANSFVDTKTTATIENNLYSAVAVPHLGLEPGIMYSTITDGTGVIIRLYNFTASPITINRPFKIDVIKHN